MTSPELVSYNFYSLPSLFIFFLRSLVFSGFDLEGMESEESVDFALTFFIGACYCESDFFMGLL